MSKYDEQLPSDERDLQLGKAIGCMIVLAIIVSVISVELITK